MGKRMVIALEHVVDAEPGAIVLTDGEANGVGAVRAREALTDAAGVPQVAQEFKRSVVRALE